MEDRLHLKVKRSSKKIIQANGPEKQPGVAILVSDIIDFKTNQRRYGRLCYDMLIQAKFTKRRLQFLTFM